MFCWKIIQKNHGLPKFVSSPPLGGRPDKNSWRPWNLIHSPPCKIPCRRLLIHEVFFGPFGLHLCVWSELGWSLPFRPMRALRLQWLWAFSLVTGYGSVYCIFVSIGFDRMGPSVKCTLKLILIYKYASSLDILNMLWQGSINKFPFWLLVSKLYTCCQIIW